MAFSLFMKGVSFALPSIYICPNPLSRGLASFFFGAMKGFTPLSHTRCDSVRHCTQCLTELQQAYGLFTPYGSESGLEQSCMGTGHDFRKTSIPPFSYLKGVHGILLPPSTSVLFPLRSEPLAWWADSVRSEPLQSMRVFVTSLREMEGEPSKLPHAPHSVGSVELLLPLPPKIWGWGYGQLFGIMPRPQHVVMLSVMITLYGLRVSIPLFMRVAVGFVQSIIYKLI